tara:strand:- start:92 stop:430 length:339 start_codon:yes stop_codon:yes gene_type:complete
MALTATRLADPVTLGISPAVIYTVLSPSDRIGIVKQIILTNYTATARTVDIWMAPTGEADEDVNLIFKSLNLAAYETTLLNMSLVMNYGDAIHASASAATAINITISGVEVT